MTSIDIFYQGEGIREIAHSLYSDYLPRWRF